MLPGHFNAVCTNDYGECFVDLFITCHQQIIFIVLLSPVTCMLFQVSEQQDQMFLRHVQPGFVLLGQKKFPLSKIAWANNHNLLYRRHRQLRGWCLEAMLDYWKYSVAKSFRGKTNQHTLVKECDAVCKQTLCAHYTPSAQNQNRQTVLLMQHLIILHLFLIFDTASSFIKTSGKTPGPN